MPTDFDDWEGVFLKTTAAPKEENLTPKKEAPTPINKQKEALEYVEQELKRVREKNDKPVSVEHHLMQAVVELQKGDKADKSVIDEFWEKSQKTKR